MLENSFFCLLSNLIPRFKIIQTDFKMVFKLFGNRLRNKKKKKGSPSPLPGIRPRGLASLCADQRPPLPSRPRPRSAEAQQKPSSTFPPCLPLAANRARTSATHLSFLLLRHVVLEQDSVRCHQIPISTGFAASKRA